MAYRFPAKWDCLALPHKRAELMDQIDELTRPERTATWLEPAQSDLIVGIDQVFHFFFDDNDFNESAIEAYLFDRHELAAVLSVITELDVIHRTNPRGDNRYFCNHPNWIRVTGAAERAYALLASHGLAEWQQEMP